MTGRENETATLRDARDLIAKGRLSEARLRLDGLKAGLSDRSIDWFGPMTVLGMPRKLHSTYLKLAKAEGDSIARTGLQYGLVPSMERLTRHLSIDGALQKAMLACNHLPVPRVFHQIWIGDRPVPATVEAWKRHAGATGYAHKLWREDDIRAIGVFNDPVFCAFLDAGDYPGAVDVARYLILAREGGIYLDCDWYPASMDSDLDSFVPLIGLTALAEPIPRKLGGDSLLLSNAMIATPPGHPLFAALVAALPAVMAELPGAPAWWVTGPVIFTLLARMASVSVPDRGFVAENLPVNAPMADVLAAVSRSRDSGSGFLIAWKCW